jgi:RNA polymerase sigma-70 factor (ECF subfamily)
VWQDWRDVPAETGELALIRKAAQGDHEAFRGIVQAYEMRLVRYLTQMLGGDVDSAYDIAQETFIVVFQNLPRWQPPVASGGASSDEPQLLAPWLYRIATNRAISLIRKQGVRGKVQRAGYDHRSVGYDEYDDGGRGAGDLPWQPSFEDRAVARELLSSALSTLAEDDAACLVLHYVSGDRYGEIATRLGISSEAVRKRVARALVALRKAYVVLDTEVR